MTSGATSDAADVDSFALTGDFGRKSEGLGNDLFETNPSATSQVLPKGHKVFSEQGIIPLGDGKVFVSSLGAVVDEDRIAGAGNWRMPVSKSMALGIIASVLVLGLIIRRKQLAR